MGKWGLYCVSCEAQLVANAAHANLRIYTHTHYLESAAKCTERAPDLGCVQRPTGARMNGNVVPAVSPPTNLLCLFEALELKILTARGSESQQLLAKDPSL
jgi:hypothetical protein